MNLDGDFFQIVHSLVRKSGFLDDLAIFFAQYLPYLLVLVFLTFILKRKFWKERFLIFAAAALAVVFSRGLITEVIRFFYYRPRPFEALKFSSLISESGGSFPSGHAAFFFALSAVIFYFNKKWGYWFFVLTAVNGLARVFVGVHWLGDILGGLIVGFVSFFAVRILLKNQLSPIIKTH